MKEKSAPESPNETIATARRTLYALIGRLPDELRAEALRIGYSLRKRCKELGVEERLGTILVEPFP